MTLLRVILNVAYCHKDGSFKFKRLLDYDTSLRGFKIILKTRDPTSTKENKRKKQNPKKDKRKKK